MDIIGERFAGVETATEMLPVECEIAEAFAILDEPRSRNSSGPVTTMPSHKQAGHTTVLTKKTAEYRQKTLAMQEPSTHDLERLYRMLRCGPLKETFAAQSNLGDRRIHKP